MTSARPPRRGVVLADGDGHDRPRLVVADAGVLAAHVMLLPEGALVLGGTGVDDHALARAHAAAARLLRAALSPPAG